MELVPGLYRILDLIHEKGSGGLGTRLLANALFHCSDSDFPLVDKIIIDQDSLGRFINTLHSGAYSSITKVDFHALDQIEIKPIGIYGSKSAIVEFLERKGLLDKNM